MKSETGYHKMNCQVGSKLDPSESVNASPESQQDANVQAHQQKVDCELGYDNFGSRNGERLDEHERPVLPPRGSTTRSETVAGVREDRTGARSEASPYLRRALPGNVLPKSPLAARTVPARHREPHPPTAKPRRSAADPSGPGPVAPEPQDPRPHPDARPAARREAA